MRATRTASSTSCSVVALGRVPYERAWELQRRLHRQVAEGLAPNLLLLLEHAHVYTLGRRGKRPDILAGPEHLAQLGVEVHFTDRGGEVTYHGPGQLVGYPIVNLREWGGGPLRYVRTLEAALVATLAEFSIVAETADRPTGVWVGDSKIASIGVKISQGVTMHGFALNVDPDLSYFDHIIPCGMPNSPAASMSSVLAEPISPEAVIPVLVRHFGDAFGWQTEWAELEQLC